MTHVKAPREIFSIIKRTSGCVQHDRIRLYSNTAFWNIKGGGEGEICINNSGKWKMILFTLKKLGDLIRKRNCYGRGMWLIYEGQKYECRKLWCEIHLENGNLILYVWNWMIMLRNMWL